MRASVYHGRQITGMVLFCESAATARLTMLDPLGNARATLLTIDGRLAAMVHGLMPDDYRVHYLDDRGENRSITSNEDSDN